MCTEGIEPFGDGHSDLARKHYINSTKVPKYLSGTGLCAWCAGALSCKYKARWVCDRGEVVIAGELSLRGWGPGGPSREGVPDSGDMCKGMEA